MKSNKKVVVPSVNRNNYIKQPATQLETIVQNSNFIFYFFTNLYNVLINKEDQSHVQVLKESIKTNKLNLETQSHNVPYWA